METPTIETPAGASTETVSATRVAAETGDVSGFIQAERDARLGKPHEGVTREKSEAAPVKEAKPSKWQAPAEKPAEKVAKGPSPADKTADERIVARVREAVETSTAELKRQNQELSQRLAALATPAGAEKPKEAAQPANTSGRLTKADIAKFQALPDAPRLDDKDPATGEFLYDTASEHSIALAHFIQGTQAKAAADETQRERSMVARSEKEAARVKGFGSRIEQWKAANADKLVDRVVRAADGTETTVKAVPVSEEVGRLHGWAMLAHLNQQRRTQGLEPLPATVDHAIAERMYDSDAPADVALYLSQHPDQLAYLRAATTEGDLATRFGRIEERASGVKVPTQPAAAATGGAGTTTPPKTTADAKREAERVVERSVSSVKPPEHTLGKGQSTVDPIEQAVKNGDVGLFLELDREARLDRAGFQRRKR